ncbi:Polymer-forming protein [Pseudoxanthomonas sp. GM95]|uniref:bactofilin family protein n=1 Tax=Pseudoxanthomonas sp. GM95 TaxID=1881043 RepID=UPI0008BEBCC4|nr:polymer-forming cytoskeletal protein [Pseudoxanthomonas sp. GM95]SEK97789.1 Polymer-forming protein [Pseudoxanthomonas sp. GM95]
MSMWKDQLSSKKDAPPPAADPTPLRDAAPVPAMPEPIAVAPAPTPVAAPRPATREVKESLIASDLTIEGKIEGSGHVRIAGKFKGDVNVQGDLTIEQGAKLSGGVKANKVVIAGELEGNIEAAKQVELLASGVLTGDVKCGTMTVATGARMRGQADFGWDGSEKKKDKDSDAA